jgi:hypothetical protein
MPTVLEIFDISGRGAVVVLDAPTDLPVGRALKASIRRPDGSVLTAAAYKEWLLRRDPTPVEQEGFLLAGIYKGDVAIRSTVEIALKD